MTKRKKIQDLIRRIRGEIYAHFISYYNANAHTLTRKQVRHMLYGVKFAANKQIRRQFRRIR